MYLIGAGGAVAGNIRIDGRYLTAVGRYRIIDGRAGEYYREAIRRYSDDSLILGNLHLKGLGVERDTEKARRLFRQAVLHLIGKKPERRPPIKLMSPRGGVPAELQAELEWLASLPDGRDDLLAMARRLRDGDGFDRDLRAAFLWYEKAEEKGSSVARHEMAIMLIDDSGTAEDRYRGSERLAQSAEQGYGPSQADWGGGSLVATTVNVGTKMPFSGICAPTTTAWRSRRNSTPSQGN